MKQTLLGNNWMKHSDVLVMLFMTILLMPTKAFAEPYLAFHTKLPCASCHVNPTGGGMRNEFGRVFGTYQLPAQPYPGLNADMGKISEYLLLGGDLRYNFNSSKSDADNETASGFEVDSGQIYIQVTNAEKDLSLYIDQQIAPGSALNREAFILKHFDNGAYLKVGKMMPVLGIKLEDDTAFTRQVTGFNFDNSDNGVEYGIQTAGALYTFFATNGTSAVSNDDNKFQLGARGEFWFDSLRLGGAVVHNDSDVSERSIVSLFAAYAFEKLTFLGEVTQIKDEGPAGGGDDKDQRVGLIEANWHIAQGHNLKVTEEYHDPDTDLSEDHRVRHSIVYEYTPVSSMQVRVGLRNKQAPPQFPAEELDNFFVQTHFYF